jgi:hypothetical protein
MRLFKALSLIITFITTTAFAETFPTFSSQDLNGKTHILPDDFPGDPTIVFIAYKRGQQADVDTWITGLGLDPDIGPEFVELPVVGSLTKAIKSYVDQGMQSGITAISMRARTITLYENARNVNAPLGFEGRSDIRVLLVRPDGTVLWQTSGPATDAAMLDLKALYTASVK